MKSVKLSFDFSDTPKIVELLRIISAKRRTTQKALVIEALERYFADEQENVFLHSSAEKMFSEWDNPEDEVYDNL